MRQSAEDLVIGSISIAELPNGIRRLPASRKVRAIEALARQHPTAEFRRSHPAGRRDSRGALGTGACERDEMGHLLSVVDGLLLVTALVHDLAFATPNLTDVEDAA